MKGALLKELYALKNNRLIVLLCFYLILIPMSIWIRGSALILPLYALAFVAPLSYASHDDRHGWNDFAKALPYKREQRVGARYLVCGAEMLLPIILQAVFKKISGKFFDITIIHHTVIHFFICCLVLAVVLFVCYRFSRGLRRLLVVLPAVAFLVILEGNLHNLFTGIRAVYVFEPWFVFVTVAAGVCFVALSYMLSVRCQMPKRERRQKMRKGLSVTVCSLAAVACGCFCFLGLHGRLVPEPICSDVQIIAEHENAFVQRLLFNVRKTSNYQKLSQQEMYTVLKNLADKDISKLEYEERIAALEQSGIKLWESDDFWAEGDEMNGTSEYDSIYCWLSHVSCDLNTDNSAKYVAVTDDSETEFDFAAYPAGMTVNELLEKLEKDGIPICSFSANAIKDEYTGYIVYENLVTEKIRLARVDFEVGDGILENCAVTWVHSGVLVESDYNLDHKGADALKNDMFTFAETFSEQTHVNMPMSDCEEKIVAIGGKEEKDSVFTEYSFETSDLTIKLNDSPAYTGKVMFFGAYAWVTGAYANEYYRESEIAGINFSFTAGMSDAQVVGILKEKDVFIYSIVETADYTYDPPVAEKTYTVDFYTGGKDDIANRKFTLYVNLVNGKVSGTEVMLDGATYEFEGNQLQADELYKYLEANTDSNMSLPQLISVFEDMNNIEVDGVAAQDDTVLFEVMPWGDEFLFSLTRQIPVGIGDEYYQIHMDVVYEYDEKKHKGYYFSKWSDVHYGDFFEFVRMSDAYAMVADEQYKDVKITVDVTY